MAIVNATDAGQHEETHYLVMEYIDGLDLSRIVRSVGKLAIADACAIMRTIALGLSHAHSVGIVHRDIKPSNMMLSSTGQVKILDFGLARHNLWDEASAELKTVGQLMGTLDYMAPEQAERADAVDYRADLYSLGATLFRLLCGHAPLAVTPHLSPLAKLRLLGSHEAPSLDTLRPDAPPELVKLVKALLARDPVERPASAAHVAEQLQAFASGADLIGLISLAQANIAKLPEECFEKVATTPPLIAPLALPAAPNASRGSSSRWGWLTAAALVPLLLLAGVLITLELQKGQLVIESEAANVSVSLLKDGEVYQQMKIEPGVNTTRLYAGKYQVEIDSGSDAVQIDDKQFTIQKGATTIARVTMVDLTKPATPPAVASPESNSMPESQSIEREILELEMEREVLLSRLGKGHPILAPVERRLKQMRDFADRYRQPAIASNPPESELLFEGKTLTQWLDVLAHDRSPGAISNAFTAVDALLLPATRRQVSESLLRILPTLDGKMLLKLAGENGQMQLDYVAFPLLKRVTLPAEYYPMLARQCERSQDLTWTSRIIKSCLYTTVDSTPTALVDWLQSNVFESEERHPLLDEAAELFSGFLLFQNAPIESSLEDRMLKALEECHFLSHDFWLGGYGVLGYSDHRFTAPGTKFASQVCMHAIAALDDDETPPQFVVQAIMILDSIRGSLAELVGDADLERLNGALRKQLTKLASNESRLYALVELNRPFQASEFKSPHAFPEGFTTQIAPYSFSGVDSFNTASVALELITFVKHMGFEAQFRSELESIYQATIPAAQELYVSFAQSSPFRRLVMGERHVQLNWPDLQVPESERQLFITSPTHRQWLAAFIQLQLTQSFPDLVSEDQIKEQLQATKLAWLQSRFAQFDSDSDDLLSVDEFAKFASFARPLAMNLDFEQANKNDDKSVSVEELFEYLESESPTRPSGSSEANPAGPSNAEFE